MASTPAEDTGIIGGVDTHQDLHTAAIVTFEGAVLGTESFSTTRAGYRAMLAWFRSHGELLRVGVESTGKLRRRHRPGTWRCPSARPRGDRSRPGPREEPGEKTTHSMRSRRPRRLARDVESKWPRTAAARWRPCGCCARLARPRSSAAGRPCSSSTTRSSPRRTRCATRSATSPACGACASARLGGPDAAGYRDPTVATQALAEVPSPAGSWTSTTRSPNSTASSLRSSRNSHPICSSSKAWEPPVRASSWSPRARIPTGCAPKRASRCCAVPAHCPPRAVRRGATVSIAAGTARPTPPST